jgi:hypothetical protein
MTRVVVTLEVSYSVSLDEAQDGGSRSADSLHLPGPRPLGGDERRLDASGRFPARCRGLVKGGNAPTMTAARRLAAILAFDVVGYSRFMGEDEAG